MSRDVLLVDDEIEFAATLGKVLRRRGFAVEVAPSGETALAILRERPFAVVLLDVKMPGLDGLQVLAEISRTLPATRVILMTGHLAPGEEERSAAAGAFAYLQKPYPTDRLVAVIEDARRAAEAAASTPLAPATPDAG
jgi:DNA-binding NtrC family response regulator